MPGYSYGIKNVYRPTRLAPNAYAWSSRPNYNRADVPTALLDKPNALTDEEFKQQFSYEWFQSGQLEGDRSLTNPPFVGGAAGRIHPALYDSRGQPARILRGYIRRASYEAGKPITRSRLYFMYNPETITRDYVSYLNQAALDPFNTVFQSANDVAPPSFMDFSFTLFFDRQEEARDTNHPGVFVDYQFFDLVVRNVVPTDPNQANNALPDNGVMMVNPQDITVVFSPQISVQGRPLNATVNFEKFTHRMVPTRMSITLQMRVIYMGPPKDMVEYKAEQLQAQESIPFGEAVPDYETTWLSNATDIKTWFTTVLGGLFDPTGLLPDDPFGSGSIPDSYREGADTSDIAKLIGQTSDANYKARLKALAWAKSNVYPSTIYANQGADRYDLPISADCSGLVTEAYNRTGTGTLMGWDGHPGTAVIIDKVRQHPNRQIYKPLQGTYGLLPGDVLIGYGHVAFYAGGGKVFEASGPGANPQVGEHNFPTSKTKLTHLLRPMPIGSTSSASQASLWNDPR